MLSALVVEDETSLLSLYEQILVQLGYHVTTAEDGEIAIQLLQHGATPDLIVLDMRLPKVSGYDVLTYLRTRPELDDTYVLISSASQISEACYDLMPQLDFICKPVLPNHLKTITDRIQTRH